MRKFDKMAEAARRDIRSSIEGKDARIRDLEKEIAQQQEINQKPLENVNEKAELINCWESGWRGWETISRLRRL